MGREHNAVVDDSTQPPSGDIASELEELIAGGTAYADGVMELYERTERLYRATHDDGARTAGFSGTANWTR